MDKLFLDYINYYEVNTEQCPLPNNPNRFYVEENCNFHYSRKEYFEVNLNEPNLKPNGELA